ncbi:MAG: hypothetical protein Q9167_000354 [Letrouitia subvulpina]
MEASSSNPPEPSTQKILLHVLSPSTEVPNKLTFPDVPTSTTVRELKSKIQDAVPSKPDPARQRLIYRGKPLTKEHLSLKDVFTQEVINNSESLSLHLVLPPSPNPLPAAAGTTSANNVPPQRDSRHNWVPPFIAQPHGSHAPTSSAPSPPSPHGTPAPTTTDNNSSSIPQTGPIPMPQGAPYNHFPPHLQNTLNSSFASLNQQLGTHFAHHAQQMHQMPFPPQAIPHNNQWQQPPFSQPSFQQIIAQQQQARAAAGHQGLNPANAAQSSPAPGTTTNQNSTQSRSDSPQNPIPQPGNTNTVVRENRGPNGESFRMVIQATSISRPSSGIGQRQGSQPPNQASYQGQPATTLDANVPTNVNTNGSQAAGNQSNATPNQPPQISNPLAMFQQRLSSIETSLSQGNAPAEAVFDHAQTYLNNLASQPNAIPQGLEAPLRNRLNNLSIQAYQLRASLTNMLMQIIAEQQANQAMTQGIAPQNGQNPPSTSNQQQTHGVPTPGASTAGFQPPPAPMASSSSSEQSSQLPLQLPSTPEVYLLSSPAGPYALLLSPFGLYGGALPSTILPTFSNLPHPQMNQPFAPQWQPSNPNHPTYANPNSPAQGQQPPPAPIPGNLTLAQAQQAHQQQQQQNNQARDLVRIILPLGGHLWLLIRLFGFVYFFTAGGGQRRAILLGICAFLVFIAQTGVFRPVFQAVWDPIRRHAEGLIPLQPLQNQQQNQRRQRHQQGQIEGGGTGNRNANADANAPAEEQERANERRRQNAEPTPEQMADRLLRERREGSIWRRAERAAALFIASLVPGIGERHIAARDAAEARRQADEREREREREVQAQREREGREERELEAAETRRRESVAVSGGAGAGVEGLGAGASTDTGAGGGGAGMTSERQQQGDEAGNLRPLIET